MRFIDDVFFIWTHGEEKLKSFINHLNSSHETIKFTSEQSRDRISFLDVQVSVGEGGVCWQTSKEITKGVDKTQETPRTFCPLRYLAFCVGAFCPVCWRCCADPVP